MKRIAVVDDDPLVIRIISMGLESAGYQVESTNSASEFLQRLCEQPPDFLITDIEMPGMGGKELCFAIEEQMPERVFPIVVLTGRAELEHREWTRAIPNLHFMEKPVSIRQLISRVNECLGETTS